MSVTLDTSSTFVAGAAGAMLPPAVAFCLVWFQKFLSGKQTKPPFTEKLLRPAGHSLSLRRDAVIESLVTSYFFACMLGWVASIICKEAGLSWGTPHPRWFSMALSLVAGLSATGAIFFLFRFGAQIREAKNLKLGIRGEQAVAEILHEVADAGYRIFHDLPAGDNWNIDHVAVGPRGVFLIETKARMRRGSRGDQPAHEVRVTRDALHFPTGRDTKAIPQAERNARWLATYLRKKTGEPVQVAPIVAIPGWYVARTEPPGNVTVLNHKSLRTHLRDQPETLPPSQIRRIISALDDKCRDLGF